jgi:hemerythrin-like metal-binding protein
MRYARFNNALNTGDPIVDAQHRELFALVNDLNAATLVDADDDSTTAALHRILGYATTHFQTEEALMERTEYPNSECHRSIHREFTATAVRLVEEHDRGEGMTIGQLAGFMENWLETHIGEEDLLLIRHVREYDRARSARP